MSTPDWVKGAAIIKNLGNDEHEQCPFCGSLAIDSNIIDGRKASPSECLDCGASEIHPYYTDKATLTAEEISAGWVKANA